MKQPTSSHLVQPIAWRCPDLGLTPKNDMCRTEAGTMCQDRGIGYPCRGLSTAATKMWTSKAGFNQPSFETKLCPTRPTVARNHKLHGGHKKSLTNLQVVQYNNIRGADIPKKRGMQRRQRVGGGALVVKQPSSSHLVQPIAWRCPDLGLTPKSDVCPTEAGTMRQDSWKGFHVEA